MIPLVFQRPTDLRLCVLHTAISQHFRVLRSHTLHFNGWCANFDIIGESHAVTLRYGEKFVLREILACVDIAAEQCTHYHTCELLKPHTFQEHPYQVALSFSDEMTGNSPRSTGQNQAIQVAFPEIWGRIPITEIRWSLDEYALTWWTLHSYPNPQGITYVHTVSQFLF